MKEWVRESGENHVLDLNHTENGRERTAQDPKRNKGYTIVSKIYIYIYTQEHWSGDPNPE